MTTRTLRFYGLGYASSPVTIVATVDGTTVYSGPIPTLDQPTYELLPDEQEIMFTVECDTDFSGVKPVSITVAGGTMVMAQTLANYYAIIPNPVFTPEQYAIVSNPGGAPRTAAVAVWTECAVPPLTTEEIDALTNGPYNELDPILVAHNIQSLVSDPNTANIWLSPYTSDSHTDVIIDGVAQAPNTAGGEISHYVYAGSVITFDQNILSS